MLEVLRKNQLSGVAAVVTRYFGGTAWCRRVSARVYWQRVQSCSKLRPGTEDFNGYFCFKCGRGGRRKTSEYYLSAAAFTVASVEYGQQARILLYMKQEQQDEAERWLTEALNTATQLEQVGSEYVEVPAEREK